MNRADARKAILQTWIVQWPLKVGGSQSAPTVPYGIDNRGKPQPSPPFAIFEITNLTGEQASMGAVGRRRYERLGWIDVRLYGVRDQGTGAIDTLAEYVKDIFESTRIGAIGEHRGIKTYTTNIGEDRTNKEYPDLWCVLCRTAFEFHERR